MEKNALVRAILHRNPGYRHPDYPAARGCGESCDLSFPGSLPKSPERFPATHPSQVEYPQYPDYHVYRKFDCFRQIIEF